MLKGQGRVYQRKAGVRLRRIAHDGSGAAFLPEQMTTVELDEEAFALLCWLARPLTVRQLRRRFVERFARNATLAEIDRTVRQLEEYGFVVQVQWRTTTTGTLCSDPETIPIAPESVHLQLNNVCNLRCPSCYVVLQAKDEGSLSLERLMALVDELAEMGVFQLALGGGEPLMSPNFLPILRYARWKGLLPNVTTNGWLLTRSLISQVRDAVGEVRLSFNDGVSVHHDLLVEKAIMLRAEGVPFGFNLIVTHHNTRWIGEILRRLVALHPRAVTLIRPKPTPHNKRWYAANALSAQDSLLLIQQLRRLEPLFAETQLTVDCALSYLFYDLPETELTARGVTGCAMGKRFVAIAWNGDVYPCSHLQDEEFKAGNITAQPFRVIWETSPLFASLRAELDRLKGNCGRCVKRRFCGGCRAILWQITGDLRGADESCPFSEDVLYS
jgi:pyrroloquinoline quinone biosynthesis protein E